MPPPSLSQVISVHYQWSFDWSLVIMFLELCIATAFCSCLQLRKELDAFDPSFFEEIEDLKFNYQQAVRKIVELEDQLSHQQEASETPGD